MAAYLCVASNGVPPSISKRVQLKVQCKHILCYFLSFTYKHTSTLRWHWEMKVLQPFCAQWLRDCCSCLILLTQKIFLSCYFTVPPMLSIPNQLEGAYVGQDVILECHTEAYPASINYWTTERGDMIISGTNCESNLCIFWKWLWIFDRNHSVYLWLVIFF